MRVKEDRPVQMCESKVDLWEPARESLHRILVGVDFSEASFAAVRLGSLLSKLCRADLALLHVVDLGANSSQSSADCDAIHAELSSEGFDHLSQIACDLRAAGVQAEVILRDGIPAEAITDVGRDCDLILVGSNRSRRPWKLFRRRTVEGVLDQSTCPALVVPTTTNH